MALAAEFSRQYLPPVVYSNIALALNGVILLVALKHLFIKQSIAIDISFLKVFVFWFSAAYVSIVTTLGYYLLLVPGVLLSCLAVFFPIFIAKNNQGPIEAVASSVDIVKTDLK